VLTQDKASDVDTEINESLPLSSPQFQCH